MGSKPDQFAKLFSMRVPGPEEIEQAVSVLRNGGVIAVPSDTLYALSADASDAAAVQRVFDVKGREGGKAILLFVSNLQMAEHIGLFDETSRRLARRFWPGQLTIVVNKQPEFESEVLVGGSTVGLRVPANDIALAVVNGFGSPVTGTSANLSGGADPVSAEEVQHQIGDRVDFILDAGPCEHGVASTIVDCTGDSPRILREGFISPGLITEALRS
jgi:L-threonylcarbamoyladenylate synthase